MQFYISTKIAQAHYKSNSNKGPGWTYTNKVDTFRNIYYTLVSTFWRCIYGFKINSL